MHVKLTEKISLWQLFILIYIFEIGSSTVVGIGNEARQDAWIAVILATFIGVGIICFYYFLLSRKKGDNLFDIIEYCLGKTVSKIVIMAYIIYFFYIAGRVLRDFGEVIVSTIFEVTPIEIISITMMLVIMYITYMGIEVLSRTSEIFLPYMLGFSLFVGVSILFTGEIEFENLRPILAEGFTPVLKAVFPTLVTFPFGETIVFMLIIPFVSNFKGARKTSIYAIIFSGVILIYTVILEITTLGANLRGHSNFPALSASREISLLNFIERVDILIVFIMMFGILVKVAVFFFGGLLGLEKLFNRPYRSFVFPFGTLLAYISIIVSSNYAEHIEEGLDFVPYYLHLPFQFIIPGLLLPVLLWKTRNPDKVENND
jgi:spore germination protein KB